MMKRMKVAMETLTKDAIAMYLILDGNALQDNTSGMPIHSECVAQLLDKPCCRLAPQ